MAWSEEERALNTAISADIDGWMEVAVPVRRAALAWILEDRKCEPKRKAEVLMANSKAMDGDTQ